MALGISIKPIRPAGGLFKGRKVKAVQFTGDASKPAGGYVVPSSSLGLRLIEGVVVGAQNDLNYLWAASVDTTASTVSSTNNMTLQAFTAIGSGGTATSNASMSTAIVTCLVYGV